MLSSSSRRNNKTSKKAGEGNGAGMARRSSLEGTYQYLTRDDTIVQVTIVCGDVFGEDDPDLCLWSEFSQGTVLTTPETGSEPVPGDEGLYFLANPARSDDGTMNPDRMCVLSGTFRRSSSMVEDDDGDQLQLKAIPLASSNGCKNSHTNFQLVVKGTMKKAEDEEEEDAHDSGGMILELDVSDDFGATYYTETKVCPHTYVARKVDEGESNGKLALALKGIDDKNRQLLPSFFFLNTSITNKKNTCLKKLEACVEDDEVFPNPCRQCCVDKGINTGICNLNGKGNTCKCTTPTNEPCTIDMDKCSGGRVLIKNTCVNKTLLEACVEDDEVFPNPYRKCCLHKGVRSGVCYLNVPGEINNRLPYCDTLTNEPCFIDMDKCPVGMKEEEGYTGYNSRYSYLDRKGWDFRCVRLDACPTDCRNKDDGRLGRDCCIDKNIDIGFCNLNGPNDTCTCATPTSPSQTCTIDMSCPDDCGVRRYGEGKNVYGRQCCIDLKVKGYCYLNGSDNACKCKKRIGDNKYETGPQCTIKM